MNTDPAGHQPSISMSQEEIGIILIHTLLIVGTQSTLKLLNILSW